MNERKRLEIIVKKNISRGGVTASQDLPLSSFILEQQAVINNLYGISWFNDAIRQEQGVDPGIANSYFVHALQIRLKQRMDPGIAKSWFSYALQMFKRTSPEMRPSYLKDEIIPNITQFAQSYSQDDLLEKAESLDKDTPDNSKEPSPETPLILNPIKRLAVLKADMLAKRPYHYNSRNSDENWDNVRRFNSEFRKMARLYSFAGRTDLSEYCERSSQT